MATHHILGSGNQATFEQTALVWTNFTATKTSISLLAVETYRFQGREQKRDSVFLEFDLDSAKTLLEELASAIANAQQ